MWCTRRLETNGDRRGTGPGVGNRARCVLLLLSGIKGGLGLKSSGARSFGIFAWFGGCSPKFSEAPEKNIKLDFYYFFYKFRIYRKLM